MSRRTLACWLSVCLATTRVAYAGPIPVEGDSAAASRPSLTVDPQAVGEGEWVSLIPSISAALPARAYSPVIYDSNHMFVFSGSSGGSIVDDFQRVTLGPDPTWTGLTPPSPRPGARYGHSVIYDSLRNRYLYFGGYTGVLTNQVWQLTLDPTPQWTQLTALGIPPPGRYNHRAVYDSVRDRMIVFGGFRANHLNDVWELTLSPTLRWTQILVGGAPVPRSGASVAYDAAHDRMLLFGGTNGNATALGDLWELTFGDAPHWHQLAPAGPRPSARSFAMDAFDADRDRIWMLGGFDGSGTGTQDVWYLDLATTEWHSLPTTGDGPPNRGAACGVFDPLMNRLVVFGGTGILGSGSVPSTGMWGLDLATAQWEVWMPLTGVPSRRWGQAAFFDPNAGRVTMFGGASGSEGQDGIFNELWALSSSQALWFLYQPPTSPSPRYVQGCAYDSRRHRELFFGGFDGAYLDEVWELSLTLPRLWTQIHPVGPGPVKRDAPGVAYDEIGDRLVIYSGWDDANFRNDVWTLPSTGIPTWTEVFPPGNSPGGLQFFAQAYDPTRNALWVYGGKSSPSATTGGLWKLSLTGAMEWTSWPAGPQRYGARMVYDASRDRLLTFGGVDQNLANRKELWEFRLTGTPAWRQILPAGVGPDERFNVAMVLDPTRYWLIIHGGIDFGGDPVPRTHDDLWAWKIDRPTPTLASWVESEETPQGLHLLWTAASGALADIERRTESSDWERIATQAADESQRVLYVDGAIERGMRYGYRLRIGTETFGEAWVQTSSRTLQLAGLSSNPGTHRSTIGFTLVGSAEARLQMIDPRGRVVFAREVGAMGPGPHTIGLAGASIHPGVYWIRLTQGAETRTAKAVLF